MTTASSSAGSPGDTLPKFGELAVWAIVGLLFVAVLLDYAPKIGAGLALLIILFLALKAIPKLQTLSALAQ